MQTGLSLGGGMGGCGLVEARPHHSGPQLHDSGVSCECYDQHRSSGHKSAVSRYFPRHSLPSCELRWPASRELKAWPGDSLAGAGARTLLHIWTADDIYSLALSIGSWSMRKWSISTWRDEDVYIYVVPSNFISNGLESSQYFGLLDMLNVHL